MRSRNIFGGSYYNGSIFPEVQFNRMISLVGQKEWLKAEVQRSGIQDDVSWCSISHLAREEHLNFSATKAATKAPNQKHYPGDPFQG